MQASYKQRNAVYMGAGRTGVGRADVKWSKKCGVSFVTGAMRADIVKNVRKYFGNVIFSVVFRFGDM